MRIGGHLRHQQGLRVPWFLHRYCFSARGQLLTTSAPRHDLFLPGQIRIALRFRQPQGSASRENDLQAELKRNGPGVAIRCVARKQTIILTGQGKVFHLVLFFAVV